jgi:hypothetical protein
VPHWCIARQSVLIVPSITQGFPGIHIVRRLIETLEDIPDELETDPGDALPPNIYRVGLYDSFR